MNARHVFLGIAILVLIWVISAPLMCATGTMVQLDGSIGQIDHSELWGTLNPVASWIYTLGDFLCHQMESRTFMLNGNELPFCVRDVGLLIGFIVGMFMVIFFKMTRNKTTDTYIICSLALIIFDWAVQHVCNSNVAFTRVVTGILAGAAIAMFFCFMADALRGKGVEKRIDKQ